MRIEHLNKIQLINADCMDVLRELPDKSFDLAIVDPPYSSAGGDVERTGGTWEGNPYVFAYDFDLIK